MKRNLVLILAVTQFLGVQALAHAQAIKGAESLSSDAKAREAFKKDTPRPFDVYVDYVLPGGIWLHSSVPADQNEIIRWVTAQETDGSTTCAMNLLASIYDQIHVGGNIDYANDLAKAGVKPQVVLTYYEIGDTAEFSLTVEAKDSSGSTSNPELIKFQNATKASFGDDYQDKHIISRFEAATHCRISDADFNKAMSDLDQSIEDAVAAKKKAAADAKALQILNEKNARKIRGMFGADTTDAGVPK